jgi:Ca2+-transporting ATPase
MNSRAAATTSSWHVLTSEQAVERLESSPSGLSQSEAARRLKEYGPNELQSGKGVSAWAILIAQFKNVLIIILLLAVLVSSFAGQGIEAIAIAVIVLFAALLGFVQEYRAERAIESLSNMAAPTATAIRDGAETSISARDLVPGDVIVLSAGDRVPADARLVESANLKMEEAALTGESLAVDKRAEPLDDSELAVGDQTNMVFAGTVASYGRGKALVVATAMRTEFGKIAGLLQSVETSATPLQKNLDRVGRKLAQAGLAVVVLIVGLGLLRGERLVEMLIFGIALAVAVVPEALPAVVTISLAIGVQRMARRNALVRRLPAMETLGSTSVICTDKTGTLTKDEMTARRVVVGGQSWEISGAGYDPHGEFLQDGHRVDPPDVVRRLLEAAVLSSDATLSKDESENPSDKLWTIHGDPTEGALVVAAAKAGLAQPSLSQQYPRVDEIPFTSESKRMTTLHKTPQGLIADAKGAPEVIVAACTRQFLPSGEASDLDDTARAQVLSAAAGMANDALRVLAVATRPVAGRQEAEEDMTLLGLVGMIDPPRPEAKESVSACESAGIKPIMITGDHPVTAQAIARELGILTSGRIMTGAELEVLGDEDYRRQADQIEVYARVSPAHKLRVVTVLQELGHVAAMTGDGVNDAPALKKADIGVAMGITGTDVSKEAAAMTLTDDNFASIVAAIEEGRIVFNNIKKYLMYLLSSNIGEIGLMAGASIAGWPLPLTAVQLLYVNLATDGLPALALAVDPPEPDLMQQKPRDPRIGIFTRPVVVLMLVGGIWSATINLGLFAWARHSGRSLSEAMSMTFVSLVLIQFFKAYNFRSDHLSVFNRPLANKWLNLAIVWELVLLGLILYVPVLQRPFSTFSLTVTDWLIVGAISLTVSPVLELTKCMLRRGWLGYTSNRD